MSKELEALSRLTTFIGVYTEEQAQAVCKDIDLIKKSLKGIELLKENIIEVIDNGYIDSPLNDIVIIKLKKCKNGDLLKEVLL